MARGDEQPPPIYECHPPGWLPKAHGSANLGYVGFYPPIAGQDEDVLNETNVKNGLMQPSTVPVEGYSGREAASKSLIEQDGLSGLEDLMSQIFARRAENAPPIPPSSFKLPSRVTMNDAKRNAWFADLANPDVPLHKLGKSVPHGAKGHDLLDLLHQNNVAIPRAVWFLRVFGGNETAGLRNKPNYNPTQYSVDWANVVVGYLKKQLTEIALPMAPRPGLNVKQPFKGVLAEQTSRDRWVSRFTYSLSLLRAFYSDGLVDHRTFLSWLVQQISTCNLAQVGFVARLADDYHDGMLICRALTRPFVEACLNRLFDIRSTSAREQLSSLESLLKSLVLRSLLGLRDAFVNPRVWSQHSSLLEEILDEHVNRTTPDPARQEPGTPALNEQFLSAYEDIKRRNDAMLFRNLPSRVLGSLSSALSDIKLLNSLSSGSCMATFSFFDGITEPSPAFAHKLDILLTWSVTPLQYGDHRPYAACSLLKCWRNRAEERAIRRDRESPNDDLQDYLFDWLDTSEVAAQQGNLPSVALLFDQLVKHGLFDYGLYIQRLIARGEQGLSFSEDTPSKHRGFLQWIPLHSSSSSLLSQRKVTLYGLRVRETPEDIKEREIRKQIRTILPELFGGEVPPDSAHMMDIAAHIPDVLATTRFEQVRLFRGWLLPVLKKAIANQDKSPESGQALRAYCAAATLMARCRHYGIILEVTLFALEHAMSNEFLSAILQTLRQHVEVWGCLDMMKTIAERLFTTHSFWKTRGVQSRDLLSLLFAVDNGTHLDATSREQLLADHASFVHAFHPVGEQPVDVPVALPEILLLATDPNPEASSILANSLWYKYRSSVDWAWKVWDNTVASLRQIPSMIVDPDGRRACALRYSSFLIQVDRHLASGLDQHALDWFRGAGRNEVAALSAEAWDLFVVVLMHLVSHDSLTVTTLLEGLVYPAWQLASSTQAAQQVPLLEAMLPIVNDLCSRLLLLDWAEDGLPPSDVLEYQGLQTGRRDVYREPHFSALVKNIPTLVLLEQNTTVPEHLRQGCSALREAICSLSVFRMATYRELDTVHDAFQAALANPEVPEEKHESLIIALKFIFNEGQQDAIDCGDGWKSLSSSLSPWKLAATSIELRFTIRQLDEALQRPSHKDRAERSMSRLAITLFGQGMDTEQADFVADMVRGVSPAVVGKFVNAGLQRVTVILKEGIPHLNSDGFDRYVANAGKVLRLLVNLAEPMRASVPPSLLPSLDATTQENLVSTLHTLLNGISDILSSGNFSDLSPPSRRLISAAIFLARVLQFDLGFPGAWTPWMKTRCEDLSQILSKLVLLFGSGASLDIVAFPLLLDTLYYLLDEIPVDPKATVFNPFNCYPTYELRSLPSDMPLEYRARMRSLLPYVEPNPVVADLVYAPKDTLGTSFNSTSGPSSSSTSDASLMPVQNRPWEWTENLGDISPADVAKENLDTRTQPSIYTADHQPVVRNAASLSLDLFGARVIGKYISPDTDAQVEGNLRMLQDDLLAESVFKRDFRESRVDPAVVDAKLGVVTRGAEPDEGSVPAGSDRQPSSRIASPVGSVRSRGSMQPPSLPSGSRRTSPVSGQALGHSGLSKVSGSSAGEPIDVDSLDLTTTNVSGSVAGVKRKAGESEDDDIEIIEGPVAAAQTKRLRGKAKAKNR